MIDFGARVPAGASFEQLHVGALIEHPDAEPRSVIDDLQRLSPCEAAMLDRVKWTRSSSRATDSESPTMVTTMVTRWRHDGQVGWVHTDSSRRTTEGETERAFAVWRIDGAPGVHGPERVAWDFASQPWSNRIAQRLESEEFTNATSAFDGTIGIAAGDVETQFRLYRGKVLEAGRKSLDGPTFTVHADEMVWVEMLAARKCDYVRRAGARQFTSTGNSFQYLRMFKAIMLLLEAARDEVREYAHA